MGWYVRLQFQSYENEECFLLDSQTILFSCDTFKRIHEYLYLKLFLRFRYSLEPRVSRLVLEICLCPIHWSQALSRQWRYSWGSAETAPTTSELSTNLLPTKVWLILDVWWYMSFFAMMQSKRRAYAYTAFICRCLALWLLTLCYLFNFGLPRLTWLVLLTQHFYTTWWMLRHNESSRIEININIYLCI